MDIQLPDEIILNILEQFNPEDENDRKILRFARLANSTLRDYATPILYSVVILSPPTPDTAYAIRRLEHIRTRPDLMKHIRHAKIGLPSLFDHGHDAEADSVPGMNMGSLWSWGITPGASASDHELLMSMNTLFALGRTRDELVFAEDKRDNWRGAPKLSDFQQAIVDFLSALPHRRLRKLTTFFDRDSYSPNVLGLSDTFLDGIYVLSRLILGMVPDFDLDEFRFEVYQIDLVARWPRPPAFKREPPASLITQEEPNAVPAELKEIVKLVEPRSCTWRTCHHNLGFGNCVRILQLPTGWIGSLTYLELRCYNATYASLKLTLSSCTSLEHLTLDEVSITAGRGIDRGCQYHDRARECSNLENCRWGGIFDTIGGMITKLLVINFDTLAYGVMDITAEEMSEWNPIAGAERDEASFWRLLGVVQRRRQMLGLEELEELKVHEFPVTYEVYERSDNEIREEYARTVLGELN